MDEAGKRKLLEEYAETKTPEIREKIILEYAPLVKVVAGRLSMYLGYNVEYDDLVGYGIFGLIDAIDKFDCMKEVKFETYTDMIGRVSYTAYVHLADIKSAGQAFEKDYIRPFLTDVYCVCCVRKTSSVFSC